MTTLVTFTSQQTAARNPDLDPAECFAFVANLTVMAVLMLVNGPGIVSPQYV